MQEFVAIIDDDHQISVSVKETLESIGLCCSTFASADEFLNARFDYSLSCLVIDIRMPYKSGIELFFDFSRHNKDVPAIFITAYSDIKLIAQAMKAGAIDVLEKPFHEHELINAVNLALRERKRLKKQRTKQIKVCKQAEYLTKRELEVFKLLIEGKFNKMIASELHLSPRTVERHRSNLMKKMEVKSLPDLVYCAQELKQAGQLN